VAGRWVIVVHPGESVVSEEKVDDIPEALSRYDGSSCRPNSNFPFVEADLHSMEDQPDVEF
jgi:hypothetical protein